MQAKWTVDNRGPDEGEQKRGSQATTFCDGADGNDRGDSSEHALVNGKHQRRNARGTHRWLAVYAPESKVLEVTDVCIGAVAKGERVTPKEPLEGHDSDHRNGKENE